MPTYLSHLLLKQLQQQTLNHLQLAISELQMIPHVRFAKKPAGNSWSANECLQHLNSYGLYYLPAIENAIAAAGKQPASSPTFRTGWLGNYFTRLMTAGPDNKPVKKMQSPKEHQPKTIIDSYEVISTFIDQQEKLLQLLEAAKQQDLNAIRIPVSISKFIRLKMGDTFSFLVMHNNRHVLQAQRALGSNNERGLHAANLLERAMVNNY